MCCSSKKTFAAFIPVIIGVSVAMATQNTLRHERPPRLDNPGGLESLIAAPAIPQIKEPQVVAPDLQQPEATSSETPAETVPPAQVAPASEVSSNSEAEQVMNSADAMPVIGVQTEPLLPADRPEWVARPPQISDSIHYISVGGEPAATFEESLKNIDASLVAEGRRYVNQYLLDEPKAGELPKLTADWIRANWLVENKTYDAEIKVPSGTYHQAWVELRVSLADREIVKQWYQESKRQDRVFSLGVVALVGLGGVGLMRGAFGFASRKAQKMQAA
jgi:hypothetical protein